MITINVYVLVVASVLYVAWASIVASSIRQNWENSPVADKVTAMIAVVALPGLAMFVSIYQVIDFWINYLLGV
jgi:hypothetical protein